MRCPLLSGLLCSLGVGLAAGAAGAIAPPLAAAATTPRTVNVVVVPNLAGVRFTLDGVSGTTGPGGTATVADTDLADAAGSLDIPEQQLRPDLRVSLDRVVNDPDHGAFSRVLVAGLDEDRPVTMHFLTPSGTTLPIGQVESTTLNDSLGRTLQFDRPALRAPIWLAAARPTAVAGGIAERVVTYSVKSVRSHGADVVNSGQLRFTIDRSLEWDVPVIFHSLTIRGNDLLGGAPAGSSITLTYPNQTKVTVPFGHDHQVSLPDLPRGTYRVRVNGGVLPLATTVRLSKDQTATELVVTGVDVAEIIAIGAGVLAIVVAAGALGRRLRRRPRRVGTSEAGEADRAALV